MRDVFESLFPGQVEHAEMLIDTSSLEEILRKRRHLIEQFDDFDALYRYQQWRYDTWKKTGKLMGCSHRISEPTEPQVRVGGLFKGKKEDAFEYYNNKIKEYDGLADQEYDNIVETRLKWRDKSLLSRRSSTESTEWETSNTLTARHMYSLFVPSNVRKKFFGEQSEFFHGTGMVTFKSISAKQSAVQCNLSGRPYWMLTNDAPDPRDLFWNNVGVDRKTLESRKILVQCVLFIGLLGWGAIVTAIHGVTRTVLEEIPGLSGSIVYGEKQFATVKLGHIRTLSLTYLIHPLFRLFTCICGISHTSVDSKSVLHACHEGHTLQESYAM